MLRVAVSETFARALRVRHARDARAAERREERIHLFGDGFKKNALLRRRDVASLTVCVARGGGRAPRPARVRPRARPPRRTLMEDAVPMTRYASSTFGRREEGTRRLARGPPPPPPHAFASRLAKEQTRRRCRRRRRRRSGFFRSSARPARPRPSPRARARSVRRTSHEHHVDSSRPTRREARSSARRARSSQRHAPAASAAAASAAFSFSFTFSSSESRAFRRIPLASARRRRDASDARSVSASAPRHARRSAARVALDALQEVFRGGLVRQRALRGPQRAEAVDVRDERGAARAPRARCASHRFALVRRRASSHERASRVRACRRGLGRRVRRLERLREALDERQTRGGVEGVEHVAHRIVRYARALRVAEAFRDERLMARPENAARERHAPRASSAVLASSPSVAKGSSPPNPRARQPARAHLAGSRLKRSRHFGDDSQRTWRESHQSRRRSRLFLVKRPKDARRDASSQFSPRPARGRRRRAVPRARTRHPRMAPSAAAPPRPSPGRVADPALVSRLAAVRPATAA